MKLTFVKIIDEIKEGDSLTDSAIDTASDIFGYCIKDCCAENGGDVVILYNICWDLN